MVRSGLGDSRSAVLEEILGPLPRQALGVGLVAWLATSDEAEFAGAKEVRLVRIPVAAAEVGMDQAVNRDVVAVVFEREPKEGRPVFRPERREGFRLVGASGLEPLTPTV